ncbi:MAG TPA: hypothetical protein VIJ14_03385, partial [Rhabdochlamydiaceae bacterium]
MNSVNAGAPLYTLPKPLLIRVRSFLTDQEGRTAALACKNLAIADEAFLEVNSTSIWNFVYDLQTKNSSLYYLIRPLLKTLEAAIGQPLL